jgi:hypothetical protein
MSMPYCNHLHVYRGIDTLCKHYSLAAWPLVLLFENSSQQGQRALFETNTCVKPASPFCGLKPQYPFPKIAEHDQSIF